MFNGISFPYANVYYQKRMFTFRPLGGNNQFRKLPRNQIEVKHIKRVGNDQVSYTQRIPACAFLCEPPPYSDSSLGKLDLKLERTKY